MRFGPARGAAVLAALTLTAAVPASGQAAFPGRNGQLTFGGSIVNPDGTGMRTLVDGSSVAWSADGMRIAFVPQTGGIATADADGGDVRVLSTDPEDGAPTWSPDGTHIAFTYAGQIFTMRADGSDRRELTFVDPDQPTSRRWPDWSPDGSTIAYVQSMPSCASTIAAIHPDGSPAATPALPIGDTLDQPDWAPDGSGVAVASGYQCNHHAGSDVVGPTGVTLASYNPANCPVGEGGCIWFDNAQPAVAPDGTRVAYRQVGEETSLRTVAATGGDDRLVVAGVDSNRVDWRPLPAAPPDLPCTQRGGHGHDVLVGTPGDDVLCGGGGPDLLIGRGGNDVLIGGPGNDVLSGGAGLDRLFGEGGKDTLLGGADGDVLVGGASRDILSGAGGADSLLSDGDGAADVDLCGDGPDLLLADAVDRPSGCSP